MKHRILAILVLASVSAVQVQSAEAGPLLDALRNRVGQASFIGKALKGSLELKAHHVKAAILNKIFPCFRADGCV